MHESVMQFLREALTEDEVRDLAVVEVGSYNVNGSPREVIEPMKPFSYVGIDIREGPGVDLVRDYSTFDHSPTKGHVIIATELLEHARDWRACVYNLKDSCLPGGILIVTTRSAGFPLHPYPDDYWRFSVEHFQRIFADMEILILRKDWQHPGVFMKARKPEEVDLLFIEVDFAPKE